MSQAIHDRGIDLLLDSTKQGIMMPTWGPRDTGPDVAVKARKGAARLGKSLKEVVNMALRVGLDVVITPPASKPYRTKPRPLGLREGFSYDNISELLARINGEDHS